MRRSVLVTMIVLGAIITIVGASGIHATFTDRATTGTNRAESGERPRAADLKLATMGGASIGDCQIFQDDLATGVFAMSDVQPGDRSTAYLCLQNAGSSTLSASMTVIDLVDVETGCTGDEAAAGDATCGSGQGEIGQVLFALVAPFDCTTGSGITQVGDFLVGLGAGASLSLGTISPGAVQCLSLEVGYPLNRTDTEVLIAQSDEVTWRFAFDGTAV
jgi:hypothetical protein